jgi:hypothetical protein
MNNKIAIIALFSAIIIHTNLQAQNQQSSFRIGLGAALSFIAPIKENAAAQKAMILPEFLIPIDIIQHLRIEPIFGLSQTSYKSESNDQQYTATQTQSESLMRIGIGILYTSTITDNLQINIGIRPSTILTAKKSELNTATDINATSVHTTAINIATTIGGEYFLGKKFSLGIEAQLNYYNEGNPKIEPAALSPSTSNTTALYTSTFITARLYF